MKATVVRLGLSAFLLAGAALAGAFAGGAQQMPPTDVQSALLAEVRGLRAALEQMATAGPRVQLALGRVQLQEQRIANQIRRLDAVRDSLVPAQKGLEPLEREVKDMEDALRRADPDPGEGRRMAEDNLKEIKAEAARRRADVQRLLSEEAILVQDINAEQARWTDFNQRLEELERLLARR